MPPLLVCPDKFKGTIRAPAVAAAIGRGLEAGGWEIDLCPVADGGDGLLEVLMPALGGETTGAEVADPLGRPVKAGIGLVDDGDVAVLEMASASGLALIHEDERDAEAASTTGTGELIAAAIDAGAATILVGVGGSATTDGGAGAIRALREAGGLRGARLIVLCDVITPFERAAIEFAPQKGADRDAVKRLTARLRRQAAKLPRDPRGVPMTGAAGGLSGGLWAAFDAQLVSGAAFVLDALGFDQRMRAARAVVTGEGRLDAGSLRGKAVAEVATRARQAGVPAHAIVGANALDRFGARILDLQHILEAGTPAELERTAVELAGLV